MNPSGYRIEEKKESDYRNSNSNNLETKSTHSYKSTHSSRSSVLERAREYNRRIDQQNKNRRAKSLERSSNAGSDVRSEYSDANRSRSAGRATQNTFLNSGNQVATRERAMASVRKDTFSSTHKQQPQQQQQQQPSASRRVQTNHLQQQQQSSQVLNEPVTPASTNYSRSTARSQKTTSTNITPTQHRRVASSGGVRPAASSNNNNNSSRMNGQAAQPNTFAQQQQQHPADPEGGGEGGNAVVTPELLVDALSGHEDGLLAIAEKLMEHYDSGYDVMGEAIIDAFADVQKLFQHVVEAAHMEGAAFEASRREAEMVELRQQQQDTAAVPAEGEEPANPAAAGPTRHDEFVDQDVKDVLSEAIRKGASLRDNNKHDECYHMYEQACQSASALLPVDSDHRGRLQLSIARAESMGPDRACAILRYAMDDVLRSGLRAGRTPLPDLSKRADVVLTRPSTAHKVAQSPDEALASLMEEMKEIMNAPVYNDTPLQAVATRFWAALLESQKSQQKNSEKLEQSLGKLKGDFLLARAEWEEKLNQSNEKTDLMKEKYEKLKEQYHNQEAARRHGSSSAEDYMEQARSTYNDNPGATRSSSFAEGLQAIRSNASGGRAGSVTSMGSGIALHAKKLVNSINDFNCNSEKSADSQVHDDMRDLKHRPSSSKKSPRKAYTPSRSSSRTPSTSKTTPNSSSRSFREYSKSPKRMDV